MLNAMLYWAALATALLVLMFWRAWPAGTSMNQRIADVWLAIRATIWLLTPTEREVSAVLDWLARNKALFASIAAGAAALATSFSGYPQLSAVLMIVSSVAAALSNGNTPAR
jgi:hypothetical protein